MRKLIAVVVVLSSGVALAAGKAAKAGPLTEQEKVDSCVRMREQVVQCKEDFIDRMMALRARTNPQFGAKYNDAAQREEMRKIGLKEVVDDGTGPLEPRQARCRESVAGNTGSRAELEAVEACYQHADCKARLDCLMPQVEKLMAQARK